jgi:hypothetical protein
MGWRRGKRRGAGREKGLSDIADWRKLRFASVRVTSDNILCLSTYAHCIFRSTAYQMDPNLATLRDRVISSCANCDHLGHDEWNLNGYFSDGSVQASSISFA